MLLYLLIFFFLFFFLSAELTLPQFYQFLKDMEQAKSALDYYS